MKLTKHISTVLSALILFANIGLALNVHYCHGQISSVSLAYKTAERCKTAKPETKTCCGKMVKTTKSCCKHNVIKLQDKTDTAITKAFQLDLNAFCAVGYTKPIQLFYAEAATVQKETPSFYRDSNAPPLFKLYCQYVLYA